MGQRINAEPLTRRIHRSASHRARAASGFMKKLELQWITATVSFNQCSRPLDCTAGFHAWRARCEARQGA